MTENTDLELLTRQISKMVSYLPENLANLLGLRYGLGRENCRSPDEIAKLTGFSADRAAALENTAIRKMRRPKTVKALIPILDRLNDEIWAAISDRVNDSASIIFQSDCQSVDEKLPGEVLLAIRIMCGDIRAWISSHASESETAWFRIGDSEDFITNAFAQMKEIDRETFFPAPVGFVLDRFELNADALDLLMILDNNRLNICREYVAIRPIDSPGLRAIRVHLYLACLHPGKSVDFGQIVKDYNEQYKDDEINAEILEIMVKTKINLFRRSGSGCLARGETGDIEPHGRPDENACNHIFERPWDETNAKFVVRDVLETKGILHRKDIVELCGERTSGHIARSYGDIPAVSAALRNDPEILEFAPSVYGLRRETGDPEKTEGNLLLTRRDCAKYVIFRHAGEPVNTYPLWTEAMELKWLEWMEKKMTGIKNYGSKSYYNKRKQYQNLFESLLYVSDPDKWSVSRDEKIIWNFRKNCLGTYRHHSPVPDAVWKNLPSLQDIFTVCELTRQFGYANHIRINQALAKNPITNPAAAPVLCILILLEVVLPAENWQKKHKAGPLADERTESMVCEIRKKGFLHWEDDIGRSVRREIQNMGKKTNCGWIDGNVIRHLSDALFGKSSAAAGIPPECESSEDGESNTVKSRFKANSYGQMELPFTFSKNSE